MSSQPTKSFWAFWPLVIITVYTPKKLKYLSRDSGDQVLQRFLMSSGEKKKNWFCSNSQWTISIDDPEQIPKFTLPVLQWEDIIKQKNSLLGDSLSSFETWFRHLILTVWKKLMTMITRDFQNIWDLPKVTAKRSHSFRFLLFIINDLISSQESRKELKSLFQKVENRII